MKENERVIEMRMS
jgi:hypothetical protein